MELAAQLTLATQLHKDALVQGQAD